jgi:hypothetical protein
MCGYQLLCRFARMSIPLYAPYVAAIYDYILGATRAGLSASNRKNRRSACFASPAPQPSQPASRSDLCDDQLSLRVRCSFSKKLHRDAAANRAWRRAARAHKNVRPCRLASPGTSVHQAAAPRPWMTHLGFSRISVWRVSTSRRARRLARRGCFQSTLRCRRRVKFSPILCAGVLHVS